jgi:tetratricopeptide (TPR) repeat protein
MTFKMRLKTLILLLFLTFNIYAQNADNVARLDKANAISKSNPDSALVIFQEIMKTESDTSVTYAKSFFNIAVIYEMKNDLNNTRIWYEKIMNSKLNPKHPSSYFLEPYALYQHNAAMQLGVFLFRNKLYDEAYKNFEKALVDYLFDSDSGTSIGKRINTIDIWKARCRLEKGNIDEALAILMSSTLRCYSPMNDQINKVIKQILDSGYEYKQLKKKVDKGLEKIKFTVEEKNIVVGKTNLWEFPFGDAKIITCGKGSSTKKDDIILSIKSSVWYKGK